jgi:hypothetical protein
MRLRSRASSVGFALLSLILAITLPASAQVINACVQRTTGLVRIVAGPSDCRPSESPLSWNQTAHNDVMSAHIGETGGILSENGAWLDSASVAFPYYTLTFKTGVFSGPPHCVVTPVDNLFDAVTAQIEGSTPSATFLLVVIRHDTGVFLEPTTSDFYIFCQNPN